MLQTGMNISVMRQMFATVSACLIVVASGTSYGWTSPTLVYLRTEDSHINMTSSEASWMVSIIEAGCLVSPFPSGFLADKIGRKPLILLMGPPFVISWMMKLFFKSFISLCVARVIQGLTIGAAFTVIPMYLGEIASHHIRGGITSFFQIAFYFGFLYEYILGPFVSFEFLVLLSLAIPVVFLVTFFWQPESPHYYAMKGKRKEAEESLMWLRGATIKDEVTDELDEMLITIEEEMKNKGRWKDLIATPADKKALWITQIVGTVRILSGIFAIVSYSTDIFSSTGFTIIPDYVMTIIMGSVLFVSAFFSTALTDRLGRKPLLIISSIGSALSLGVISVYFFLLNKTSIDLSNFSWICPLCIILYNLFVAFGLEPVSMTYRSELFPTNTRALAAALSTIIFTLGAFFILKIYQVVTDEFGIHTTFAMFSLSCVFGTFYSYFYAIETKNKTLAEIKEELSRPWNQKVFDTRL